VTTVDGSEIPRPTTWNGGKPLQRIGRIVIQRWCRILDPSTVVSKIYCIWIPE